MSTTYEKSADYDEVHDLIGEIVEKHHGELHKAEVTVGVTYAFNEKGPAVKLHGVACAAVIKINSLKARAEGAPDATITIDGKLWRSGGNHAPLPDARRRALIDHEINHLMVSRDKEGQIKADDLGRPKLRMRPHDFEVGWFKVIARRHGSASFEVQQAAKLVDNRGQLLFPWAANGGPEVEADVKPRLLAETQVTFETSGGSVTMPLERFEAALGG